MKVKAHVTDVSDHGDKMLVTGQGRAIGKGEWRPWLKISVDLPVTKTNQKAFRLGRHFTLNIKPD